MDRDYWRSEPTKRLIEEARTKGCELCRAIGERLEDIEIGGDEHVAYAVDRAKDFERQANRLDDKVYELRGEIDCLNLMLGTRDERIAELEAALKKDAKK